MATSTHATSTHATSTRTANAQVFTGVGSPFQERSLSLDPSSLLPGETLVELTAATVCGSDVHTVDGHRVEPTPLVLGHEGVGRVVASRAGLPAGARVTWAVAVAACAAAAATAAQSREAGERERECAQCRAGLPQKCARGVFKYGHARWTTGDNDNDGCSRGALTGTFASHIVLRAGTAVVVLDGGPTTAAALLPSGPAAARAALPDAIVAPANCALATVVCALERAAAVLGRAPATVLVQGCGLLGLYAVALAAEAVAAGGGGGPTAVVATDTAPARLALARRFGAAAACDARAPLAERGGALAALADVWAAAGGAAPAGFDVVLELAGARAALAPGVAALGVGGVYVLCGLVHPDSALGDAVTAEAVIRKCAALVGVHNYAPWHLEAGVDFLARHWPGDARAGAGARERRLPLDELVAPPARLGELAGAFEAARAVGSPYARQMVVP